MTMQELEEEKKRAELLFKQCLAECKSIRDSIEQMEKNEDGRNNPNAFTKLLNRWSGYSSVQDAGSIDNNQAKD